MLSLGLVVFIKDHFLVSNQDMIKQVDFNDVANTAG